MGNFGSILVTLVTVIAGAAGTYLQIESWRHTGYEMYDTTIGDLERFESAANDPVSLAWSIGVIQQSFTDFTEPCDSISYEVEFGFLRMPRLCPLTSTQRDLLFRRLQNLECVQLQSLITRSIDEAPSRAAVLRITDGVNLARGAFDSFEQLACSEMVSFTAEEPVVAPVTEPSDAYVEDTISPSADGTANGAPTAEAEEAEGTSGPLRGAVGARAQNVVDVSILTRRVTVHVPEGADEARAEALVAALGAGLGRAVQVFGPEYESRKIPEPVLNFLKSRDGDRAQDLLGEINATGALGCSVSNVSGLGDVYDWNPAVRPRTFELWLPESCLP